MIYCQLEESSKDVANLFVVEINNDDSDNWELGV